MLIEIQRRVMAKLTDSLTRTCHSDEFAEVRASSPAISRASQRVQGAVIIPPGAAGKDSALQGRDPLIRKTR